MQPRARSAARVVAPVVALLGVFVLRALGQAGSTSATYDETAHLPAGYSYWLWHDFRLNPEHPPLLKQLAALPLLWLGPWPRGMDPGRPETAGPDGSNQRLAAQAWQRSLSDANAEWTFGHAVLFGVTDRALGRFGVADRAQIPTTAVLGRDDFVNDADRMLRTARRPIVALGALLGLLVFAWARELYGLAGGLVALALYCLDPSLAAHSALVTTDVGLGCFFFGALYGLWRACRRLEAGSVALLVGCTAAALASKFTALLLPPVLLLAGAGRVLSPEPWPVGRDDGRRLASRRARALVLALLVLGSVLGGWATLWAVYGFRYAAAAPVAGRAEQPADRLPIDRAVRRGAALRARLLADGAGAPGAGAAAVRLGPGDRLILLGRDHRLLPEAYLYGLALARNGAIERPSYLLGRHSDRGFRGYFPAAFLVKTPLLTLLAILAAVVSLPWRRQRWNPCLAFLLVPVAAYGLVSILSSLNIGHRHLLPVYPFLFVLCGGLAIPWSGWRSPGARALVAAMALAGLVVETQVVGGPPGPAESVHPHYLAWFNRLAGGPRGGYRWLVDSNLDWGQDLPALKAWADAHGVSESAPLNLCYFGTADPRYYGIPHLRLPGGSSADPPGGESFAAARLPGFVAISATNYAGAYFSPEGRQAWDWFLARARLVDTVGYSILVFRLDSAPR